MRRIARTVAAVVVVILGLALVSVAAVGANPDIPIGRPDVPQDDTVGSIPPFQPKPGTKAALPQAMRPGSFDGEFGQRGKHDVEVSLTGNPQYAITWRDDKEPTWGIGNLQRSRTINSGFPVVQIALNSGNGRVTTCVITVDGVEKDRQSTSTDEPIVFCEA